MWQRFLHALAVGCFCLSLAAAAPREDSLAPPARDDDRAAKATSPNFVVILADDLGYADVGFQGSQIKTPVLDRLAADGLRLAQHYVYPMCSPTRAALLSGRCPSRFGCTAATNKQVLPFGAVTLASALQRSGYQTSLTGKWHLGSSVETPPNKFGFDYSYGSLAGSVGPYDHRYKIGPFTHTWHRNARPLAEKGHATDLITQDAVRFIKQPHDRPFFLYVPYTTPHIPLDEPDQWLDANRHLADAAARLHAASITHMDACIGQIVDVLDQQKLRDNTLIIFLSDNGAHRRIPNKERTFPGEYADLRIGGSNAPLRGYKRDLYEGGIRTPAVVNWPARLPSATIDTPLHVTDWMPTLCRLAGVNVEAAWKCDGQDIWPFLSREKPHNDRAMYWLGVDGVSKAVRQGDWKLIIPKTGDPELYNITADPRESHNMANDQPERVATLREELSRLSANDNDAVTPPSADLNTR